MPLPPRFELPSFDDDELRSGYMSGPASADEKVYSSKMPKALDADGNPRSKTRRRKVGIFVLTAGLVLAGTGTAFAYMENSVMKNRPISAVPSNAFAYAEVNLDPSTDQKLAFKSLADANPELFGKNLKEMGDSVTDVKEDLAGALEGDYVYAKDVAPWMGDRVGVAAWGGSNSKPTSAVIYQVKDAAAADASISKFNNAIRSGNFVIAGLNGTDKTTLDTAVSSVEVSGSLRDNKEFNKALKTVDADNIAYGWVDTPTAVETLGNTVTPEQRAQFEAAPFYGSGVSSLALSNDGVHLKARFVSKNEMTDSPAQSKNMAQLGDLPENAVVAVAVGNSDKQLANIYKTMQEKNPKSLDSVNQFMTQYGVTLPNDSTRLVGTDLFGALFPTQGFQLRIAGADQSLLSNVISTSGQEGVNVTSDAGNVLVNYGDVTAQGKLSDNKAFVKALPNLKDAEFAAWVNVDSVSKLSNPASEDKGSAGFVGAEVNNVDKKTTEIDVNWILNNK